MNKEKPQVLSDEEFDKWCEERCYYKNGICHVANSCNICRYTAQRDDTWQKAQAYYEPLIQQAKAETDAISYTQGVLDGKERAVREMLQDMREHIYWSIPMFEAKWKSKYMEGKTGFTDEELKDLRHNACDNTIGYGGQMKEEIVELLCVVIDSKITKIEGAEMKAAQILSLLKEEIKKVENPYLQLRDPSRLVFDQCRQAILKIVEEK